MTKTNFQKKNSNSPDCAFMLTNENVPSVDWVVHYQNLVTWDARNLMWGQFKQACVLKLNKILKHCRHRKPVTLRLALRSTSNDRIGSQARPHRCQHSLNTRNHCCSKRNYITLLQLVQKQTKIGNIKDLLFYKNSQTWVSLNQNKGADLEELGEGPSNACR